MEALASLGSVVIGEAEEVLRGAKPRVLGYRGAAGLQPASPADSGFLFCQRHICFPSVDVAGHQLHFEELAGGLTHVFISRETL